MFATNHTEQEEAVEMLPGEVSRRLKLFHQEQLRQQQHQGVQFSSSPTSTLDSGILDAKVIKKKISDNSELQGCDSARVYWHSAAHVLGQAIELCLGTHEQTQVGETLSTGETACEISSPLLCDGPPLVGSGTDQGFYYQVALPDGRVVSEEDLMRIEKEMHRIAREKQKFECLEVTRSFARLLFQENAFKLDILDRIPESEPITVFRNGHFVDLCRGPHISDTSAFGAIKVLKSSAAHFRCSNALNSHSANDGNNDENRNDGRQHSRSEDTLVPVQRIYGIAFPKPKQLRAWEKQIKLAKERDHRTIGTSQDLFMFDKSSPGSPFFLPHGTRILNRMLDELRALYWKSGYEEVRTPLMFHKDLWDQSGHLANYAEDMYGLQEGLSAGIVMEDEQYN